MTGEEKDELALSLYLNSGKTQKDICKIVGWNEKTFIAHKKKGRWDEEKAARSITDEALISGWRRIALDITNLAKDGSRPLTSSEVDQISKLSAAIKNISHSIKGEEIIKVFEMYNRWLVKQDPDLAQENNKYQDLFIRTLAQDGTL